MNDTKTSLDRVPNADTLDIAQVFSAGTMKTLVEVIKPHLEVGKRKIVYIFPASDAIGHISGEMHILWSLYGKEFDEILVVIGARNSSPMPDGPARVVNQYVTFVETTDTNVMLMGHFTAPPQDYGLFELKLTSSTGLCNIYYPSFLAKGIEQHFKLPPDMIEQGEAFLHSLGWRPGEKIIPVHGREMTYLPSQRYHSLRSVRMEFYRPAIDHLLESGAWVFRLGDPNSTALEHPTNRFIDLPHLPNYEDWMDVFLISRAYFSLNCSSGPASYCQIFDVPSLLVNNVPQTFNLITPTHKHVYMFKKFRDVGSGELMSYSEILDRDLSNFSQTQEYVTAAIQVEENTADEILEAVQEMEARLEGRHVEDRLLQDRFRKLSIDYDQDRIRRITEGTAPQTMHESPHYCFSFSWVTIVEAFCRRHPSFLKIP